MHYDVAIIGGGPGGSTTAAFLKKYDPECNVVILEREQFPRDHVGESMLPPIMGILQELGAWDKVEAANFPIKIGVTLRWGKDPELWSLDFFPKALFKDEPRPARFEGQRRWTAFQVDRSIYDDILLRHAEGLGAEVREGTKVVRVEKSGDHVGALVLESGEKITADYVVDASGHVGFLRRAMDVGITLPTNLQNIAVWDYWQNADWAVEIGVGGTFVQVLSLGYGWFWFIPLGPTRTSIGFVTSADYFKKSGLTTEQLYQKAMSEEPRILDLVKNAQSEGKLQATKDWSFVADRLTGDNWLLVGESAGFADPVLAAGLSLTHASAREAALTLIALRNGSEDPTWLKSQYERIQKKRVSNHIRFADYWYTANAQFTDLKDFTREIAASNGLDLSPEKAWQWLAQGGFLDEEFGIGLGGFTLDQVKEIGDHLSDMRPAALVDGHNVFRLNLDGATRLDRAIYPGGEVKRSPCYERGSRVLPVGGVTDLIIHVLSKHSSRADIVAELEGTARLYSTNELFVKVILSSVEIALEAMISDGWITAEYDPAISMSEFPNKKNVLQWLTDRGMDVPESFKLTAITK
jgi:flavin-dependent dehydrogenase